MRDEGKLDRWLGLELGRLNQSVVVRRRSLKDLLQEERPTCKTKEGTDYLFDMSVLEKFAAVTNEEEKAKLRLPITLYFHVDIGDQCTLSDEVASETLRRLEGFGKAYPFRDGKMWLPYSLGLELALRYPTAFQRLILP